MVRIPKRRANPKAIAHSPAQISGVLLGIPRRHKTPNDRTLRPGICGFLVRIPKRREIPATIAHSSREYSGPWLEFRSAAQFPQRPQTTTENIFRSCSEFRSVAQFAHWSHTHPANIRGHVWNSEASRIYRDDREVAHQKPTGLPGIPQRRAIPATIAHSPRNCPRPCLEFRICAQPPQWSPGTPIPAPEIFGFLSGTQQRRAITANIAHSSR